MLNKENISNLRANFAILMYEKFKRDCYGIENCYDEREFKEIKDKLEFATYIPIN